MTETLRDAEAFYSRLRVGLNRLSFDERRRRTGLRVCSRLDRFIERTPFTSPQ